MKQFLKYIIIAVISMVAIQAAQAKSITVNAGMVRGDLTEYLRKTAQTAGYNDTLVINFDKGEFTVSGTVSIKSHVIIRGAGRGLSTIILDKGSDRPGFKAFTDDAFFKVYGTKKNTISVSISDITFRLKDHKGIWWDGKGTECYAFKAHHADPVVIRDVDSYMQDAKITNFDLQVCSNVTVTGCTLSNYNNSDTGGNLWLRGEMHNILVKDNKFYKYGKDEALAVFDRLVDHSKSYTRGAANRTDIFIQDNEFYYGGYPGKSKDESAVNRMIVSLFTDHRKSADRCTTRNYHLSGNKFYINDLNMRCIYVSFDPADSHEDIYIENNQIFNSALKSNEKYYRQDIEVNDLSNCGDTIHIVGNVVNNKNLVINNYDGEGYSFLLMQGGNVSMRANRITNEATVNPKKGKTTGVQLVWCGADGGTVTMRDNVCKGIKCVAYVGAGDGTQLFTLNASNNYFAGDTRVYCHKIKELNLNFTNNTFKSDNMNFFLVEFAPKGSVVFDYNDVTVSSGDGQFMTHWGKNSTNSMRFDLLEVKGNKIKGVKSESDMFRNVTNVRKRKVNSNRISR